MQHHLRNVLIGIWLLVIVGYAIYMVADKESTVSEGELVLVELGVRDPLSLLQGQYMVLQFPVFDTLDTANWPLRGRIVLHLDTNRVVTSVERHGEQESSQPRAGPVVEYKLVDGVPVWGARTFLFQQDRAEQYEGARYAAFRISSEDQVLVGLRDESRNPIESP